MAICSSFESKVILTVVKSICSVCLKTEVSNFKKKMHKIPKQLHIFNKCQQERALNKLIHNILIKQEQATVHHLDTRYIFFLPPWEKVTMCFSLTAIYSIFS